MDFEEFLSTFKLGETVLVEYSAYSRPEILFYDIVTYSKLPIVVDDIMDTLREYYIRLELSGIDVGRLESLKVIKTGGSRSIGNVLGKLELGKYIMNIGEYTKIMEKAGEPPFTNPVLGIHKLIFLGNMLENMKLLKMLSDYVGNESRVAFYFLNRDATEKFSPAILAMMEEISTSVVLLEGETIIVKKAIDEDLLGEKIPLLKP
ncbi:hypothetical protein A3L04_01925 [Thermococcus chitonophagus]|uniref:DUF835 domain-containing protein n=1 Tax=Thermococcus chitonophagus TaxID=54262 RepID=A0A160VU42_9EURY|nr:DUF257 family protein [Thermococcus chitonophagus]ASJ15918.1 hypothetical protein A3L04_01925 [Thermococcus chitonophagus]CUX77161.1 hypothetical protein CHITON_0382 [Thermococcus chitonophagus]